MMDVYSPGHLSLAGRIRGELACPGARQLSRFETNPVGSEKFVARN